MAAIENIPETYTTLAALAADEIFQCRAGTVEITTDAVPAVGGGWLLRAGQAIQISAGAEVSYRRFGGTAAVLTRGAV